MRRWMAYSALPLLGMQATFCAHLAYCAPPPIPDNARLVKPLDASTLQKGSPFYVTTVATWRNGGCIVRANTMIRGQVTDVARRADGAPKDKLSVNFEPVPCYGNETEHVTPLLGALSSPDEQMSQDGLSEAEMQRTLSAVITTHPPIAPRGQVVPKAFGSNTSAALNIENEGVGSLGLVAHETDAQAFKTGEVRHIRGVKMELPTGGTGVTSLVSSHSITLEPGTQFMLFLVGAGPVREITALHPASINSLGTSRAAGASASPSSITITAASPNIPREDSRLAAAHAAIEQAELCAAGCAQIDNSAATSTDSAAWSLSLASFGLRPRLDQVRADLDDDASVHFLGEDEILVTVNPHTLTRRSPGDTSHPRQVRAILLSRKDGGILKAQEWPVFDDGQYTWDLGDGRILAHVGHDFVIYGSGLTAQQHFRVEDPLLFAEVAPVRGETEGMVAIATVHEKHTPEAHQNLVNFLGPDWQIDEDYGLTVLNPKLEVIGSRSLDARPVPTALLTTGMVSTQHDHGQRWKVVEESWEGKSELLKHLSSGCKVDLTSMPDKLLFANACAADRSSTYYWVLNSRGSVLLAGHAPGTEFVQQAGSSANGAIVAVAATESSGPLDLKLGAKTSDFRGLSVSVYRVSDGRRILTARPSGGSALRQTFALAPSGESLAVLSGSALHTYSLSPQRRPALEAAKTADVPVH